VGEWNIELTPDQRYQILIGYESGLVMHRGGRDAGYMVIPSHETSIRLDILADENMFLGLAMEDGTACVDRFTLVAGIIGVRLFIV